MQVKQQMYNLLKKSHISVSICSAQKLQTSLEMSDYWLRQMEGSRGLVIALLKDCEGNQSLWDHNYE